MHLHTLILVALLGQGIALPAVSSPTLEDRAPQLLGGLTDLVGGLLDRVQDQTEDLTSSVSALLQQLDEIVPSPAPTSIEDVISILQSAAGAEPTALVQSVMTRVTNGLGPDSLEGVLQQYSTGSNSENNVNTREPATPVYPQLDVLDAPYSISEEVLRGAIHIPDTFTYGQKPPVILVPGTATKGGFAYEPNLAKLLPQEDYADPLWLNIPGWLLESVPWNSVSSIGQCDQCSS